MHNTVPSGFSSIKALDREAKQIHTAEVLDISVNGYRIKWSGITPANLKTGEFILVQENLKASGVVVSFAGSNSLLIKVWKLVWKFSHRNCSLAQSMPVPTNTVNYQPAILVQMTQLDQVSTSIIVSGSQMFREKQTIHLRLGQKNSEST